MARPKTCIWLSASPRRGDEVGPGKYPMGWVGDEGAEELSNWVAKIFFGLMEYGTCFQA